MEYYGYGHDNVIVTLYRLQRNSDGLMTSLEGCNKHADWQDVHGALEMIESDPDITKLSAKDAKTLAEGFGKKLES